MTTNFEKVVEFHKLAGVGQQPAPCIPDTMDMGLALTLIREELLEVEEAFHQGDVAHFAKECADLAYVVYRLGIIGGFNMDKVFREVHDSNMSKFCTREEADLTRAAYRGKGYGTVCTSLGDGLHIWHNN